MTHLLFTEYGTSLDSCQLTAILTAANFFGVPNKSDPAIFNISPILHGSNLDLLCFYDIMHCKTAKFKAMDTHLYRRTFFVAIKIFHRTKCSADQKLCQTKQNFNCQMSGTIARLSLKQNSGTLQYLLNAYTGDLPLVFYSKGNMVEDHIRPKLTDACIEI